MIMAKSWQDLDKNLPRLYHDCQPGQGLRQWVTVIVEVASVFFRLEILEDLQNVDSVFICVGGGGLIAGIATYMKAKKPSVKVNTACNKIVGN